MRKVIIRKGDEIRVAELVGINNESVLQELLLKNPSIIPISEIREGSTELVFAVKEFWTDLGYIDILAFNPNGDIAIIECKMLDRLNKIYEAVGQVFAYASSLWGMSYEELNSKIKSRVGRGLVECVRENYDGKFSEEEFINGVSQNLRDGSFILIVAVGKIDDKLKTVINYINEHSEYAFSIHALEINVFKTEGDLEVLIPYVYGISTKPTSATRSKRQWDEKSFFEALEENNSPDVVNVVRKIYEWCKSIGIVKFGKGARIGSFNLFIQYDDKEVGLFGIDTDGRLWIPFEGIRKSGVIDEQTLEEFRRRAYETLQSLSKVEKYPTAKISEVFTDENDLEKFKGLIKWIISRITHKTEG